MLSFDEFMSKTDDLYDKIIHEIQVEINDSECKKEHYFHIYKGDNVNKYKWCTIPNINENELFFCERLYYTRFKPISEIDFNSSYIKNDFLDNYEVFCNDISPDSVFSLEYKHSNNIAPEIITLLKEHFGEKEVNRWNEISGLLRLMELYLIKTVVYDKIVGFLNSY